MQRDRVDIESCDQPFNGVLVEGANLVFRTACLPDAVLYDLDPCIEESAAPAGQIGYRKLFPSSVFRPAIQSRGVQSKFGDQPGCHLTREEGAIGRLRTHHPAEELAGVFHAHRGVVLGVLSRPRRDCAQRTRDAATRISPDERPEKLQGGLEDRLVIVLQDRHPRFLQGIGRYRVGFDLAERLPFGHDSRPCCGSFQASVQDCSV